MLQAPEIAIFISCQEAALLSCVECGMYRQILLQITGTVNVLANFRTRLTTLLANEPFKFLVLL